MRIVAGVAKGRRLAAVPSGTRPTSDRAREALFSSLIALIDLDDTRVLDLFAGTGAVGLEALSRGAAEVVFVESDRTAAATLQRNADAVALAGVSIDRRPVSSFLAREPQQPFDLVFADPPYALDDETLADLLAQLAGRDWLADGAVVVVERSARSGSPRWPEGITPLQDRRYGEATLWYGRRR